MLRVGYSQNYSTRSNLGIGGFDLAERAYSNENERQPAADAGDRADRHEHVPEHAAAAAPVSAANRRRSSKRRRSACSTASRAAARRSPAASTRRTSSCRRISTTCAASTHMRTGIALEGRHYRTDSASNYLGTFIFSNGETFLNGRPRNYTQRIGDPLIVYSHLEAAAYVQDDMRLRPNLTFSPGLRYEMQTHVHDLTRLRSAARPDVGARQERRARRFAPATASSTTGSAPTSTSRRCASTASASAKSTSRIRRFPNPGGDAHRQRQQQVRARRHHDGAHPSLQRRDRSHHLAEGARQPVVLDGAAITTSCAA